MRGLKRQKQTVYWSRVTETLEGIDTVPTYSQPQSFKFSVSSTAGTPEEISAGIVPEDGIPTTPPDYRLKKILDTQRGNLARYGIKKIGAEE